MSFYKTFSLTESGCLPEANPLVCIPRALSAEAISFSFPDGVKLPGLTDLAPAFFEVGQFFRDRGVTGFYSNCLTIGISLRDGDPFKSLNGVPLMMHVLSEFLKIKQQTWKFATAYREKPRVTAIKTSELEAAFSLMQRSVEGCFKCLNEWFASFHGQDAPAQNQQAYFQAYHTRDSLSGMITDGYPKIVPFSNDQFVAPDAKKIERVLDVQYDSIWKVHFVYRSYWNSLLHQAPQAASFLVKLNKCLETQKPRFKVYLSEAQDYLVLVRKILERYDDPIISLQSKSFLNVLHQLLHTPSKAEPRLPDEGFVGLFDSEQRIKAARFARSQAARVVQLEKNKQARIAANKRLWAQYDAVVVQSKDEIDRIVRRFETLETLFFSDRYSWSVQEAEAQVHELKDLKEFLQKIGLGLPKVGHAELAEARRCTEEFSKVITEHQREVVKFYKNLERESQARTEALSFFSKGFLERDSNVREFVCGQIKHLRLVSVFDVIYREGAVVGDGGTAAMVFCEAKFGVNGSERSHIFKCLDLISELKHCLVSDESLDFTSIERCLVSLVLRDLETAKEVFFSERGRNLAWCWQAFEWVSPAQIKEKTLVCAGRK